MDKAKQIFLQARRFRNAGNLISNALSETNDVDLHVAPFIVNAAFSTELYLKCIYVLEYGKLPGDKRTHRLDVLFERLSQESKDTISALFEGLNSLDPINQELKKHVPDMDESLKGVLKGASNAFQNWRYNYELKPTSFQSSNSVMTAMEVRIFELKPEWNETPHNVLR